MHRVILLAARVMAFFGGVVLCALILLTCVSVLGRSLNGFIFADWDNSALTALAQWMRDIGVGSINGDYELVEAGIAFAIFAFLPLCHLTGGHARVDIFTSRMSPRTNRVLAMLSGVVFALVMGLITVQLAAGMFSKMGSGQTTFLLEFPVWWAYACSLVGALLAAIVATYLAVVRMIEMIKGRTILPEGDT